MKKIMLFLILFLICATINAQIINCLSKDGNIVTGGKSEVIKLFPTETNLIQPLDQNFIIFKIIQANKAIFYFFVYEKRPAGWRWVQVNQMFISAAESSKYLWEMKFSASKTNIIIYLNNNKFIECEKNKDQLWQTKNEKVTAKS